MGEVYRATDMTLGRLVAIKVLPEAFASDAERLARFLGTAAYMAPEQARGKAADKRADIWAFGVVLFEMLTGQRPFAGEEVSDVFASVLARDPDLRLIPDTVPGPVRQGAASVSAEEPEAAGP